MKSSERYESHGYLLLRELFTQGKRVFTMHDIKALSIAQNISPAQLRKILSNLTKRGSLLRLRRGLYVGIGLHADHADINPFVVSAYLIQPSAISHWSALQYHGLTEQVPQIITASTTTKIQTPSMREKDQHNPNEKHAWEVKGIRYEYIYVPDKHYFGLEKIWRDENYLVNITDKERTLLDVFINPKMFGGIGEALGILENSLYTLDIKKLVSYAIQYDKKSVSKRLGWALEYFGVQIKLLEPLLNVPIHYFCRLNPSGPGTGPCDKRWMIQNNLIKAENK